MFLPQYLKSVVTSVRRVRPPTNAGGLTEVNDIWWLVFANIPLACTGCGLVTVMGDPPVYKIILFLDIIIMASGGFVHGIALYCVHYLYRDKPFRLMGAKGKFMLEVIPIIMLAAIYHLLEFNYGYLSLVVGITTYIYTIAHFMHVAYDIGGKDVLLGIVMQVIAYILDGGLLVRGLALSLCVALCYYRYVMYSAPQVPTHRKKELEQLPC